MKLFLHIYDYFEQQPRRLWALLSLIIAVLCCLISRIDYREDVSDFMPFDAEYRKAMQIYQDVAAGNQVVLLFNMSDTTVTDQELVTSAVARFGELLTANDTDSLINDWQPQIDLTQVLDVFSFVYEHLPIYLTAEDYARMDSAFESDPELVLHRLQRDYDQINSLAGSFIEPVIQNDPLGVGSQVALKLRQFQPELQFQHYNDYIFTPDGKRCLVTFTSPFGSSETDGNTRIVRLLDQTIADLHEEEGFQEVVVSAIGSPVIAVANASCIKHDSILAVTISAILILTLLIYSFRNLWSLFQIVLSTGFGFLFALGFIGIFHDTISVIVLGISSIIIGIAVNYPLHYLCHIQQEPDPRTTLRELIAPLFIGNATTVGAFLTLVPLDAVAVRDLGLFSALMLVGTIIFVLIFLPHLCRTRKTEARNESLSQLEEEVHFSNRLTDKIIHSRVSLVVLLLLTGVFGWFSWQTEFDSDLNHINYMTANQRADLAYLSSIQGQSHGNTIFVSASDSTSEESIMAMEDFRNNISASLRSTFLSERNPIDLLPSIRTQQQRIQLWHAFWERHGFAEGLTKEFVDQAANVGFSREAFQPFEMLLTDSIYTCDATDYELLTSTILTSMVRGGQLVAQYQVEAASVNEIEEQLRASIPDGTQTEFHIFDLASLNSRVSDALSDNFNYIGYACSVIVFLFLWFSFRRIELAILAFLPMAIGWLWILGLMELLDIQFNIVNVILASFIFGQGDDYTIFVTEGLIREYKEGRQVLVHYQRSILLSALIMLIGIGSLILAKHPAMHSLAEVTIIGMSVVVVMAWIVPPMVFNLLIRYDKSLCKYLKNNN